MMRRIVLFALALPLAAAGALWFWFLIQPWPVLLRWQEPESTAFMEQRVRAARETGDSLVLHHTWVPLEGISPDLRRAVIIAEDGRFREHGGVDWAAIGEEVRYTGDDDFSFFDPADLGAVMRALAFYRANSDRIRGRSTITQQLAKNLYFTGDRSPVRKIRELVVAKRLEWLLGKDRILELYLNVAEWGPGIFGAEAAARHYFGRSAADLSRQQAAALAATLPHPLTSNPAHRPARMAWRRELILRQLQGGGPPETVPLEPVAPDVEVPVLGTEIEIPDEIRPDAPDTAVVPDAAPSGVGGEPPPEPPDTTRPH